MNQKRAQHKDVHRHVDEKYKQSVEGTQLLFAVLVISPSYKNDEHAHRPDGELLYAQSCCDQRHCVVFHQDDAGKDDNVRCEHHLANDTGYEMQGDDKPSDEVGVEPTMPEDMPTFKAGAINHSTTHLICSCEIGSPNLG